MFLRITADNNEETGVGDIVIKVSGPVRKFFENKNYGSSVSAIGVVLMCRDPKLDFTQRIRFAKEDKTLYADIMLNYESMVSADEKMRFKLVQKKIVNELPQIVEKYKFEDFNLEVFTKDLVVALEI